VAGINSAAGVPTSLGSHCRFFKNDVARPAQLCELGEKIHFIQLRISKETDYSPLPQ
jgi:hypothetical protein